MRDKEAWDCVIYSWDRSNSAGGDCPYPSNIVLEQVPSPDVCGKYDRSTRTITASLEQLEKLAEFYREYGVKRR